MDTIESLTAEFHRWSMDNQDEPFQSADDLLAAGEGDYLQHQWLRDFAARWDFAQQFEGTLFTTVLEAWLDHRAKGPDESSGYTDKGYYRLGALLSEKLDSFFTEGRT